MKKGIAKCHAELARQMAQGQGADKDAIDAISEELESYVQAKMAAEKFLL